MELLSWRKALLKEIPLKAIEYCNPPIDSKEMKAEFDPSYGGIDGCPFICFTKDRVYFPGTYDGSEWVASVPRNYPCEPIEHVGGG